MKKKKKINIKLLSSRLYVDEEMKNQQKYTVEKKGFYFKPNESGIPLAGKQTTYRNMSTSEVVISSYSRNF